VIAVNLIPTAELVAWSRRRHLYRWAVALVVAVASGILPFVMGMTRSARISHARGQSVSLNMNLAEKRKQIARVSADIYKVQQEIDSADALRSKRCWSQLIAIISRSMPEDVWLTSLATNPTKPTESRRHIRTVMQSLPSANANVKQQDKTTIDSPTALVLKGYSLSYESVQTYVGRLKATGVFDDVLLQGLEKDRPLGEDAFRFELVCDWGINNSE